MTLHRDAEPVVAVGRVEPAPEFPVLDTLRFVGALCVVTTHTSFQSGAYTTHGIWGAVLARLDVGVAIFFVLSGFLLFRPHIVAAVAERPGPRVGRYYWKRFLRIYPVYAVTVVIAMSLIPENQTAGVLQWLRTLLMLDSFVADALPQGLTQMWSLAVEVSFYLVLPWLAALVFGRQVHRLRPRRFGTLVVAMVVVSLVWHVWIGQRLAEDGPGAPLTWLPSYLTWFAVGMTLAYAHVRLQEGHGGRLVRLCTMLGSMPGACWVAVAGLMMAAATPIAGPTQLYVATAAESTTKHLVYAAIGGFIVVTGVFAVPSSPYATVLGHPWLRHLGHISYSTFCLHLPVLYFVFEWGGYPLFRGQSLEIWLWTVGISLVLSELAYRLLERPAQRLRGLSWRRTQKGSQPSASAHAETTRS